MPDFLAGVLVALALGAYVAHVAVAWRLHRSPPVVALSAGVLLAAVAAGLGPTELAGIALALACIICWWLWRKRRRKPITPPPPK